MIVILFSGSYSDRNTDVVLDCGELDPVAEEKAFYESLAGRPRPDTSLPNRSHNKATEANDWDREVKCKRRENDFFDWLLAKGCKVVPFVEVDAP